MQSLVDATGGKFIRKRVIGPAGNSVSARYGMLADGETAVIEMAEASGLPLVSGKQMNPLKTTTFGTGELILDAAKRGATKIIIGIGAQPRMMVVLAWRKHWAFVSLIKAIKKLLSMVAGGNA